jgi:hypothetical protein
VISVDGVSKSFDGKRQVTALEQIGRRALAAIRQRVRAAAGVWACAGPNLSCFGNCDNREGCAPMTLTIDLPEEQIAGLAAKARAQGVTAEQYARLVLEHDLGSVPKLHRHISEVIRENMRSVPPEMLAAVPKDAASEHDHYIYGLPKRDT